MKKILLTGVLSAAMLCAIPALAQDEGAMDQGFLDDGAEAADATDTAEEAVVESPGAVKKPAAGNTIKTTNLPPSAKPAPPEENVGAFYISGGGGLNLLSDADIAGPGLQVETNFTKGYQFAGALGLRLSKDFRVETELSYRMNDIDTLTVGSAGGPQAGMTSGSASGDMTAMSAMLNVYGDMDIFAEDGKMNYFKPYIMGGIGMSHVEADISSRGIELVNDDDYAFTYQFGLGLGYALGESTALDLGYRYLATSDLEFNAANNGPQFDTDYSNHTFMLGVRHEFNRE